MLRTSFRGIRTRLARVLLGIVKSIARDSPVPIDAIRRLRALGGDSSALVSAADASTSDDIQDELLRRRLDGLELGLWALGPRSIGYVAKLVATMQPSLILECGSGSARSRLRTPSSRRGGTTAGHGSYPWSKTPRMRRILTALLGRLGLGAEAAVIHAPLDLQDVGGDRVPAYLLPERFLELVDGRQAQLLLIDGPSGAPGIRFSTVPVLRPFLTRGATFLLDDALRDGELEIADRWSRFSYVRLVGIWPQEHGLLIGATT